MKKALVAAIAITLATTTTVAIAADVRPYYTAPGPISSYSWTGPYLGGNLGYQWGETTNNPTSPSGVAGGVQGGINWQAGQIVFGAEADITVSGAEDTFAPWKFSNPWFSTLRGRIGYALNNILFYGTAGFALGGLHLETTAGASERNAHVGWAAGAGMEVGLTPNWSARVEYLYVDLPERAYILTGTDNGLGSSVLRLGVNYRF